MARVPSARYPAPKQTMKQRREGARNGAPPQHRNARASVDLPD
jgi:hypothetical protein